MKRLGGDILANTYVCGLRLVYHNQLKLQRAGAPDLASSEEVPARSDQYHVMSIPVLQTLLSALQ